MGFDPTPNGTTGARQPTAGRLMRLINRWVSGRIRKGGKLMGGTDGLVLTTVGRKTGAERSTPVNWFPGTDGGWLIVASAAGAQKNPAWYYNLAANPDKVWIETADGRVAVTAEQLHGGQREDAWDRITAASSLFARYQQKTDRELPVIRLVRRAG